MTKHPVGMSVGVCEAFFNVFGSVWVCVGVLRNAEMSGNWLSPQGRLGWVKNFKIFFLHIFSDHGA